jgi:hypothetical protein
MDSDRLVLRSGSRTITHEIPTLNYALRPVADLPEACG